MLWKLFLQIPMLLIVMFIGRIRVQNRSAGLEKSTWFESVIVFCPGVFLKPVVEFRGFSAQLCSHVDMYTKKARLKSRIFRKNLRDSITRFPACQNKLLGELGRRSFHTLKCPDCFTKECLHWSLKVCFDCTVLFNFIYFLLVSSCMPPDVSRFFNFIAYVLFWC